MPKPPQNLNTFEALMELVAHLRGPEGCPWDKEQDHKTLAPYAVEEIYELVEALEEKDDAKTKDELGDVLFQVALHAQLAEERKAFTIQDVLQNLNEKMVRRHPHVFSDVKVKDSEEVWKNWEKIKKAEKKNKPAIDIPEILPALQRSYKIGVKTQKMGFDWDKISDVVDKVKEELQEFEAELHKSGAAGKTLSLGSTNSAAQNSSNQGETQNISNHTSGSAAEAKVLVAMEEELGDLLFSVAQLVRHCGFEPEQTLRASNRKFLNRYNKMLQACAEKGVHFENLSLEEKESLWQQIKKA